MMDFLLNIAVCDALSSDARRLVSSIECLGVSAQVGFFSNGEDFLGSRPAGKYDLVFLEVFLEGLSGIETAKALRALDESVAVVFTTLSRYHMLEAFDVGAQHYLVKPVEDDKLHKIMQEQTGVARRSRKFCMVNVRGKPVELALCSISHIEVLNHNCFVFLADGKTIETGSTMTIRDFAQRLPSPQFLRCHKSYMVNMDHVEKVERDFVMKNGSIVYIRRSDVEQCTRAFKEWQLCGGVPIYRIN